jgi:preprotein translocase subunit SecA
MNMSVGNRMAIDPRTHQRVMRRVVILNYIFLAAELIGKTSDREIIEDILFHLEDTRDDLEVVWGEMEFERCRLADQPLSTLDGGSKKALAETVGEEAAAGYVLRKVDELNEDEGETLKTILGKRVQNSIYRHILVSVISELWVDYLTKVDALRVSIGLEAFAQRDPLVQYKSKASEMFKELLSDIRLGVITRMFVYQPRRAASAQQVADRRLPAQPAEGAVQQPVPSGESKKKRKRH